MSAIRAKYSKNGCFEDKLEKIIHENPEMVKWGPCTSHRQVILVRNSVQFSRKVLPTCTSSSSNQILDFRHAKFSSFVRQLNSHGYVKSKKSPKGNRNVIDDALWEFERRLQHNVHLTIDSMFSQQRHGESNTPQQFHLQSPGMLSPLPPLSPASSFHTASPVSASPFTDVSAPFMISPVNEKANVFASLGASLSMKTEGLDATTIYPSPASPLNSYLYTHFPVDPIEFAPIFEGEFHGFPSQIPTL